MEPIRTQKEILALQRGKRLRICRDYTGLNIKEFCQKYGFNTITFGRWERGNKVSLNERNVNKVCQALMQEGVVCTATWILEGTGLTPTERSGQLLLGERGKGKPSRAFGAMLIFSEMAMFHDNYENAVVTITHDTAMEPYYEVGDHLGGIRLAPSDYELADKKNCLVKTTRDSKILVRTVQLSGSKIILTATNPNSPNAEPIVLDVAATPLEMLAPIVFHRKNLVWIRKKA